MTQIDPKGGSQLDRIDHKLDQILDRLTRMEERQNTHAGKLEAHSEQLTEHGARIRNVELAHAVAVATTEQQGNRLMGRWAALGAGALIVLGAIGTFLGNAAIKLWGN